jgi:hypothetical protein
MEIGVMIGYPQRYTGQKILTVNYKLDSNFGMISRLKRSICSTCPATGPTGMRTNLVQPASIYRWIVSVAVFGGSKGRTLLGYIRGNSQLLAFEILISNGLRTVPIRIYIRWDNNTSFVSLNHSTCLLAIFHQSLQFVSEHLRTQKRWKPAIPILSHAFQGRLAISTDPDIQWSATRLGGGQSRLPVGELPHPTQPLVRLRWGWDFLFLWRALQTPKWCP